MQAEALATTVDAVNEGRGGQIRRRRERLGLSVRELAMRAGVDRGTLDRLETSDKGVRSSTFGAVESALERLEEEMGLDAPAAAEEEQAERKTGLVRFEVTGVYGADALVVEGPIENIAELQAAVDRIMRGASRREGDTPE